jgi:hypothetical protein
MKRTRGKAPEIPTSLRILKKKTVSCTDEDYN